ncbi:unnamed protein product [Rotaria magnacalcarata]|uniref:Armadillo repeat-containing protein 8 n=2 Tax=Rotaria magnacalcarata TaxID=392030 RepID=A0A815UUX9_9BILA|nr:unnamed protein product [Rotaria magnacalcarata]CAF1684463.1 unnamed protein product [Rotaria magnacalcarata]CAF2077024.1 unnamed protein product [Rotaria magnacalcarata]
MPCYDDDRPTQQEELLIRKLLDNVEQHERIQVLTELKNLIIGSRRCKLAFYHAGILEILNNLLKEYSCLINIDILVEILDCISSFAKVNNKNLLNHLIELGFIEQILSLLTIQIDSNHFYESCLRCLRSFFLSKIFSNPYLTLTPFILLNDDNKHDAITVLSQTESSLSNDKYLPVDILFENSQNLDIFPRLLSISKSTQISIIEILCCACVNNERQNQIVEKDFIQSVMHLLVENILYHDKINLVSVTNEYLVGVCLKLFCSICYENDAVARQLQTTVFTQTNETLCEIISSLLNKTNQPVVISYYASKFFINLCKTKVLSCDDSFISHKSLTTLVHLCTKSTINKSIHLYIACFDTLIYLLNGNSTLHHTAMYTEQFLNKLFCYLFAPTKIFNEIIDEAMLIQIRTSTLTLLAVLSSYHEDIKKRIADQDNLISTAIECYRSNHRSLQLASLCLFHGLSRSVHQLRTTFNDTICDILLDAVKSSDLSLVKLASSAISNTVLEFSTCRAKLLSGGILDILLAFLAHPDHDLSINGMWALRNLSYLSTLKIKQDVINGLTIDRIYSLLEQCTDERFLICLLSLLRNIFNEKDTQIILPMFNPVKLLTTLQKMHEKNYSVEVSREISILIDHLNSSNASPRQRLPSDSVNPTCRTSLFPEYACDEMDELDCL